MTVYNRKMFRKKAGGATGIMASGPELIKAANGVFMGPGNPTQPNTTVRIPSARSMQQIINRPIQTSKGGPGEYKAPNFIPTSSTNPLSFLFPREVGLFNLMQGTK